MGEVKISKEKAYKLIDEGICRKTDFIGLEEPYFVRLTVNKYKCLRCSHPITSFMGIMQHIKKHKNQEKRLRNNVKLNEVLNE